MNQERDLAVIPERGNEMVEKFTDCMRGYLIDNHWPPVPQITLNKVNMKEHEAMFKKSHIDHLMVYCKDHWGYCYYNTKIGPRHPALKSDYVKKVSRILKKNNIKFIAYYSIGFDQYAVKKHPDWAVRDKNGQMIRVNDVVFGPKKWTFVCTNTPYRSYIIAHLKEMVTLLKPDMLFLDIFKRPFCHCASCRKIFQHRYKIPFPMEGEDSKEWVLLREFQSEVTEFELLEEIVDTIKRINPTLAISINGGHTQFSKETLDLLDFTYAEPWAGTYFSSGFARDTGKNSQIGPGTVSYVFDPKKKSIFILETANIVSQGCRAFMFCNPQYPDGSLDEQEFENVGATYREISRFQRYLTGRCPIKSVGILYSQSSRMYEKESVHLQSLNGAIEGISYAKYPLSVIPEWELNAGILSSYQALILPNTVCLSEKICKDISTFVREGGVLFAASKSSLKDEKGKLLSNFRLSDVFGVNFINENLNFTTNPWGSFLQRKGHRLWRFVADTCLAVEPPFMEVKPRAGHTLATHILPCLALSESSWVNWWSPPPGKTTPHPAIHINRFSKGKVIYFSFDLFRMVQKNFLWPRDFIRAILEWLVPAPPVRVITSSPNTLGVTYFKKGKDIIAHLLNHSISQLEGDVIPVNGGELIVRDDFFRLHNAQTVYPERMKLKTFKHKNFYKVMLPEVNIHTIVQLR